MSMPNTEQWIMVKLFSTLVLNRSVVLGCCLTTTRTTLLNRKCIFLTGSCGQFAECVFACLLQVCWQLVWVRVYWIDRQYCEAIKVPHHKVVSFVWSASAWLYTFLGAHCLVAMHACIGWAAAALIHYWYVPWHWVCVWKYWMVHGFDCVDFDYGFKYLLVHHIRLSPAHTQTGQLRSFMLLANICLAVSKTLACLGFQCSGSLWTRIVNIPVHTIVGMANGLFFIYLFTFSP